MSTVIRKLQREVFVLSLREPLSRAPVLDGFETALVEHCELEVTVDADTDLNTLFARLNDTGIEVISLRNQKMNDKLKALGVSLVRLNGCSQGGEGEQLVRDDAFLSDRLEVSGSPTLFLNNKRYDHNVGYQELRLLRSICDTGGKDFHEECKNAPQCFFDFDCSKRGYEVKCLNPGTPKASCEYTKAVQFPMIVLVDKNSASFKVFGGYVNDIQTTVKFLPGAESRIVDVFSKEGEELVKRYDIKKLPAYILTKDAKDSLRFNELRPAYEVKSESFVSLPQMVMANQDISRDRQPGQLDFFISALDKEAVEILLASRKVLEKMQNPPKFNLHFIAYKNENGKVAARNGLPEIEESLRQLAIWELAPEKYWDYLKLRSAALSSTYWQDPLIKIGLEL